MSKADVETWQKAIGAPVDGDFGPTTLRLSLALLGSPEKTAHTLTDPAAFFDRVRGGFGALSQKQVDGFRSLLDKMREWPVSWAAYGLATAWHETAKTMQPIKEMGGPDYFRRMYDKDGERPHVATRLGNTQLGDGVKYAGRGYVQITGRRNYSKWGIENTPDDALNADTAAFIMINGMETGSFTGKRLSDYLPGDYLNARRIINGTDKAQTIADYANDFERALRSGGW